MSSSRSNEKDAYDYAADYLNTITPHKGQWHVGRNEGKQSYLSFSEPHVPNYGDPKRYSPPPLQMTQDEYDNAVKSVRTHLQSISIPEAVMEYVEASHYRGGFVGINNVPAIEALASKQLEKVQQFENNSQWTITLSADKIQAQAISTHIFNEADATNKQKELKEKMPDLIIQIQASRQSTPSNPMFRVIAAGDLITEIKTKKDAAAQQQVTQDLPPNRPSFK